MTFGCSRCKQVCATLDGGRCTKHTQERTGRTRPYKPKGRYSPGPRGGLLPLAHEFVCTCGHTGWSAHAGIHYLPIASKKADE